MATTNMSLKESSPGVTPGPDWSTNTEDNWNLIDVHDHTSGKGKQLTPSALDINSDLEFNGNAATELKRLVFDSSATGAGTNFSVYQSGGNLYWYNGSGAGVQITDGAVVRTSGGSISGMSTPADVLYSPVDKTYIFKSDTTQSPQHIAKITHSDISLYNFSNFNDFVTLKYTGTGASSILTLPDETGTLLSTSTSYGGGNLSITASAGQIDLSSSSTLDLVTSAADSNITLTPHGNGSVVVSKVDINGGTLGGFTIDGSWTADSQTCANLGNVTTTGTFTIGGTFTATSNLVTGSNFDINGGNVDATVIGNETPAAGSFTTIAGTSLDLDNGHITNAGTIDCDKLTPADGPVGLNVNFGGDNASNKISLRDNLALALDITEGSNSYLKFVTTDGAEKIVVSKDLETSSTKKLYSKGNCYQTNFHSSLIFGY